MENLPAVPSHIPVIHPRALVYSRDDHTGKHDVYDSPDGARPGRRWRFFNNKFVHYIEYSGGPKRGYSPRRTLK